MKLLFNIFNYFHKINIARKISTIQNTEELFQCNLCGALNKYDDNMKRDESSCIGCGSTVRIRSLVLALSECIYGISVPIQNFPVNKNIKGIGLSDWEPMATQLSYYFDYTNTYYHQEPYLDITDVSKIEYNKYDFFISSDVFEHVSQPVYRAFEGSASLLKSGGLFVLTIPYHMGDKTEEHFPDLYKWSISKQNGSPVLINYTKEGKKQIYTDTVSYYKGLVFHGGDGQTLQMRHFGKGDIVQNLKNAGFIDIKFWDYPLSKFGICWQEPHSVLITARKN